MQQKCSLIFCLFHRFLHFFSLFIHQKCSHFSFIHSSITKSYSFFMHWFIYSLLKFLTFLLICSLVWPSNRLSKISLFICSFPHSLNYLKIHSFIHCLFIPLIHHSSTKNFLKYAFLIFRLIYSIIHKLILSISNKNFYHFLIHLFDFSFFLCSFIKNVLIHHLIIKNISHFLFIQ